MFCIEVSKETKISDTMVLLRLFDYQGALTVRYHRLRSFYRRRLFAAYDAYGTVLYCNGNTAERFHSFCRRVPPRADTLPEDAFQGADVRSRCHALSAETFFPPFRKTARIMHNADNSGTAG